MTAFRVCPAAGHAKIVAKMTQNYCFFFLYFLRFRMTTSKIGIRASSYAIIFCSWGSNSHFEVLQDILQPPFQSFEYILYFNINCVYICQFWRPWHRWQGFWLLNYTSIGTASKLFLSDDFFSANSDVSRHRWQGLITN